MGAMAMVLKCAGWKACATPAVVGPGFRVTPRGVMPRFWLVVEKKSERLICLVCGRPLLRRNERHGPLGQGGDGQRWVHARVGGHRRAVDHIETVVAEDAVAVVDHAF